MGNIPKLRFPEFSGEWSTRKLNNLINIIEEQAGTNKYTLMSVTAGVGLVPQVEKFGKEIAGNAYKNYYVIQKGDFAYNKSATKQFPEGYVAMLNSHEEAALPNSIFICFRITGENTYPKLFDHLFHANYHGSWLRKYIAVGARAHGALNIDTKHLLELPVALPSYQEQQKIANFLTLFDKKIENQTVKVTALEEYKKGLMQKIFTREIRFNDDDGINYPDWVVDKLINLLEIRDERQTPTSEAPLMAFTSTGGVEEKGYRYNRDFLVKDKNKKYKRTELNDLIYSSNNLDVGAIGRNKYGPAVISDVYEVFIAKDSVTPELLEMIVKQKDFMNKVLKYRQGALYGQYRIHADAFLSIEITAPSFPEQTKIANFLTIFDRKIEKEKEKLGALREQKKGLLQQMFV